MQQAVIKQVIVVEFLNENHEWTFYAVYDEKDPKAVLVRYANEIAGLDEKDIEIKQEMDAHYLTEPDARAYFTRVYKLKDK